MEGKDEQGARVVEKRGRGRSEGTRGSGWYRNGP